MSGKIKPIKAKDNNGIEQVIFPNTVLEAVVDSDTNKTLDNIIDELKDKIDNIEITGGGDASNKVDKSGDTMTGMLTVKDNVAVEGDLFVPIAPEQSFLNSEQPNTNFTAPTAGGWQDNASYLLQDMANSKTFLGSYTGAVDSEGHENYWHNVISIRHRNGRGDGNGFGMYIRSALTTPGNLCWNKQYDGNWENEKVIVDSSMLNTTSNTDVGMDSAVTNAIGYVKVGNLFGQTDGAMYKQVYSDQWAHEIYGDYRTGQIAVRGKNNGTWQSWRGVLDSSNYSSYALPLTGGTVTGVTNFNQAINLLNGHLVTNFASGGGNNGYVKFAVFTCYSHATYSGAPMSFRMTTRGATGIVHLNICNSATAGQGFTGYITQIGNIPQCYIIQSSTGVFELYAAKSPWDWISITDFVFPQYQQDRMTVTWTDTFVSSLPSGCYKAPSTNDWSGVVTSTTSSVSFTLKPGYGYLIYPYQTGSNPMYGSGIIVPTSNDSWVYASIEAGGSMRHSISGTTFTFTFDNTSSGCALKYIEIG